MPHDQRDAAPAPAPTTRRHSTVATNLRQPAPRIAKPQPPRRFRHPSRKKPRQPQPSSAETSDPIFSSVATLSDTDIALQSLHTSWPNEARSHLPKTPPLILSTQLRALVADTHDLSKQLALVVALGMWREIHLPRSNEHAYVRTEDVTRMLCDTTHRKDPQTASVFIVFAEKIFPAVRGPILPLTKLRAAFGGTVESDEAEKVLVRAGWLTMRDEHSFWFAVPGMGAFGVQRENGNNELLGVVKRAPYREMLLNKAEMRSLKKSCFTAQWHLRDLVGCGKAETVDTSVGPLVRARGSH